MIKTPVSANMIDAIIAQNELLDLIRDNVSDISKEIFSKDAVAMKHFRNTIHFRSVLLTFEVTKIDNRKGTFPYAWLIYYKNPTTLVFAKKVKGIWKKSMSFDLKKEFYFQLDNNEKLKMVLGFIRKSFLSTK